MKFFGPHRSVLNGDSITTGFAVYDDISDRIHDHWRPDQCSVEEFKRNEFNKICKTLGASPEERRIYVSFE